MDTIKPAIESLADDIKDYVEVNVELLKLQATEKGAGIASSAILNLVLAFFAGSALLFASIAAALLISQYMHSLYSGFFIVAAIYAGLGLIILLGKDKWLKTTLTDNFIKSIYKD
jgi:hypothetical protein